MRQSPNLNRTVPEHRVEGMVFGSTINSWDVGSQAARSSWPWWFSTSLWRRSHCEISANGVMPSSVDHAGFGECSLRSRWETRRSTGWWVGRAAP